MSPDFTQTPAPAPQPAPAPAPTPAPAAQTPPPAPAPNPPSGAGVSGGPGSGTAHPTPAPTPAPAPAPPQPQTFEQQFRARYNMDPGQAELLLQMGYQTYRGRQQPAPQPAPAAQSPPANPFGLPQFDMNLLNFVGKDADGRLQLMPGAPPDAAIRVQEYQDKLRQVQQQFWSDPLKFLGPLIEERAQKMANEVYQTRAQKQQQEEFAARTVQQNSEWLFEKGPDGRRLEQFNPASGRYEPVLSQWGQAYRQLVVQAGQQGVTNPQAAHDYAVATLKNHLYEQQLRTQQAPAQQQQANNGFLDAAAQQQRQQPAPQPGPNLPAQQPGRTLRQVMAEQFDSNGLTEQELRRQMGTSAA